MTHYGHQSIIVDHLLTADRLLRKAQNATTIERNSLSSLANAHIALATALTSHPEAASLILRDRTADVLDEPIVKGDHHGEV